MSATAGGEPIPEDLAAERFLARLTTKRMGRAYRPLVHCGSTNDHAAALARAGHSEGLLVVADTQSGGRGRLGRVWHSPPGTNLHLSLLLRPTVPAWTLPPLTLLAGAALAEAVASLGLAPLLKWPNDLLLPTPDGSRKACGILTEMATDQRGGIRHLVLGVGVNVNTESFPEELAGRATSLRRCLGRPVDRGELLASFLNHFEPAYDRLLAEGAPVALVAWRRFGQLGHQVRLERDGRVVEGVALDVGEEGALKVRDAAGVVHRILSGEIV